MEAVDESATGSVCYSRPPSPALTRSSDRAAGGVADLSSMARRVGLVLALLCVVAGLAVLVPIRAGAAGTRQASGLDLSVLAQLNQVRSEHGLVPLTLSPGLDAAALQHTRDMVSNGYFGHASSNGTPFWRRIARYYPQSRYAYWSVGENLVWTSGAASAAAGLHAWMTSPAHRANILDPAWRQVGIAALGAPHGPGAFAGLAVTVITADFGVRRH